MLVIDHSLVACISCQQIKPAHDGFYYRLRDGERKRDGRCKECTKFANRITGKMHRQKVKEAFGDHKIWRRSTKEIVCDQAFMAWRGPVTPGLGARL